MNDRKKIVPSSDWIPNFVERSPAYDFLKGLWSEHQEQWPSLEELNLYAPSPFRFVPQTPKSPLFEENYVVQIAQRGRIQTRMKCWHDFFNALTWFAFPQSKHCLNTRMFQAMQNRREQGKAQRSAVENVGTLLDENGILIVSSCPDLLERIRHFQWKELFWEQRSRLLRVCEIFIFGHALLEKCLHPYIGMTGHSVLLPVKESFFRLSMEQFWRTVPERAESPARQAPLVRGSEVRQHK